MPEIAGTVRPKPSPIQIVIRLLRVHQWLKNGFVFAPLIFGQKLFDTQALLSAIACFTAFCLASSFVYITNDIADIEEDKLHPRKQYRPLPSGALSVFKGRMVSFALLLLSLSIALTLSPPVIGLILAYVALNIYYSFHGKRIVAFDVLIIATGFVIRVLSGAWAIGVVATDWLILATFFISLFLAIAKRYNEILSLGQGAAEHRKVLFGYNADLLKHMLTVTAGASIVSYGIYTMDSNTIAKFGNSYLVYTMPFVVFGIFRYLFLVFGKELGGDPSELVIKDKPLLLTLLLWAATVTTIIYV